MYSFLLLGFELVVLYGAFWYVFLRTPKPYVVTKDIWGIYEQPGADKEERQYSRPVLIFSNTDGVHMETEEDSPRPRTPNGHGGRKAA
jgi:hypothetical protein